ncbi:hypothetical protein GGF43_004484 [Coemansia sp. RSA 2618]|nr:hypothetical protein GGF43_004484 [Coemansia sp. RSA 2618]
MGPPPALGKSSRSSSTLATGADAGAPLLSHPCPPSYLACGAAPCHISSSFVPIGIITLEDVIEELIQEEIIDETDEFIDIRRGVKVVRKSPMSAVAAALIASRSVSAKAPLDAPSI